MVCLLGGALLVRVLVDDRSSPFSRYSGSLNLSGAIAVLLIALAIGLLWRRHRGLRTTLLAVLWLAVFTAIAIHTSGASAKTVREGVREASILAVGVIVYNAGRSITVPTATRLVQLAAFVPALLALYQLATNSGMDISGNLRSHGTFVDPNSAAMFFAIAAGASLWRFLDSGRHPLDALLTALFAAAIIATFSVDGLISFFAILATLGALQPGSFRVRLSPYLVGGLVAVVFFAMPLGARRIANESSTVLAREANGRPTTSLAWRIHKWESLIPEWEQAPLLGKGLGATTTVEATTSNEFAGEPPHNEYLRYLVESGIIGLGCLLCGLTVLVRRLVRDHRAYSDLGSDANAPALGLAIVVGCLVNALADNTLLNSPTGYAAALLVVAVLGATTGLASARRSPRLSEPQVR